jgi:alanine dehydrogenase
MIIGVPREIKKHENRISLLPEGVLQFKRNGHKVIVEKDAGAGSGFTNRSYAEAGAEISDGADEVWAKADMIMKVKEPIKEEYPRMREGQIIFTYFHFAADEILTKAVVESKSIAIAYETVEKPDRSLPLLIPMSEVAGRMAAQEGAKYLEKPLGGRGVLMGGIPGVPPAKVLVLGGGIVGVNAAKVASGMGADTIIMDINVPKLRYLDDVMEKNVRTQFSNEVNIRKLLPGIDMIIGAVLKPGAKAPHLITRTMLKEMRPGTVLVDVSIDQGGCFETSKPTTHDAPVYFIDGIVHYCVANMPGAVPYTSTLGLTNVTLPYAIQIANKGWKMALLEDSDLQKGLNIANGKIVYRDVAEAFNFSSADIREVLSA